MSDSLNPSPKSNEDDLLANAIPIEDLEEDAQAVPEAIDLVSDDAPGKEIRSFDTRKRQTDRWARQPNKDGSGASHVKTFVTKLRLDAIEHLDSQINEWLDTHPELEVKFATSTIGALIGKTTEPAMFVTVWV